MLSFREFLTEAEEYPEIKPGIILNNTHGSNFYKVISRNKGSIKVMEIGNHKGMPNTSVEYEPVATCRFVKSYNMSGGKWFNCKFNGREEQLEIWNKHPLNWGKNPLTDSVSNKTVAQNTYDSYLKNHPDFSENDIALDLLKKNKKKEPSKFVSIKYIDGSIIRIYRDMCFKDKLRVYVLEPGKEKRPIKITKTNYKSYVMSKMADRIAKWNLNNQNT